MTLWYLVYLRFGNTFSSGIVDRTTLENCRKLYPFPRPLVRIHSPTLLVPIKTLTIVPGVLLLISTCGTRCTVPRMNLLKIRSYQSILCTFPVAVPNPSFKTYFYRTTTSYLFELVVLNSYLGMVLGRSLVLSGFRVT